METTETTARVLRQICGATQDIKRIARDIERDMADMSVAIDTGMNVRSQNHQNPFDLQTALAKREAAIEAWLRLDTKGADATAQFEMAVRGVEGAWR